MMDSKTLFRCGLVWLVLLLFAIDGSSLIRADVQQIPAEEVRETQASNSLTDGSSEAIHAETPPVEPFPYPVSDHSPNWFVEDQVFSDESGLLDVKTERSCMDREQALEELWRTCLDKINPILDRWYGPGASEQVKLSKAYIGENLVHNHWIELQKVGLEEPVGGISDFYVAYGRFELDQEFRQYTKSRLQDSRTRQRLVFTALIGGTLLALLAVTLGYLKLETATRGFYSRRLQTIAIALVIALITGAFFFASRLAS